MIIESEFSDNAEGEEIFKKHLTLKLRYDIISTLTIWQRIKYAGVAELADALASGASDRKVVWVQVPSPAPSRGYKKDIARENPDFIGVFTVLYGKITATVFVDVNRSFSLYIRF